MLPLHVLLPCLHVHVHVCLCLQHSSRGDKFTAFARLEHGSTVLGEGEKAEYTNGDIITLSLQTEIKCNSAELQSLVNITKYPLIGKGRLQVELSINSSVCSGRQEYIQPRSQSPRSSRVHQQYILLVYLQLWFGQGIYLYFDVRVHGTVDCVLIKGVSSFQGQFCTHICIAGAMDMSMS